MAKLKVVETLSECFTITVTGEADKTIRCVAHVVSVEVSG